MKGCKEKRRNGGRIPRGLTSGAVRISFLVGFVYSCLFAAGDDILSSSFSSSFSSFSSSFLSFSSSFSSLFFSHCKHLLADVSIFRTFPAPIVRNTTYHPMISNTGLQLQVPHYSYPPAPTNTTATKFHNNLRPAVNIFSSFTSNQTTTPGDTTTGEPTSTTPDSKNSSRHYHHHRRHHHHQHHVHQHRSSNSTTTQGGDVVSKEVTSLRFINDDGTSTTTSSTRPTDYTVLIGHTFIPPPITNYDSYRQGGLYPIPLSCVSLPNSSVPYIIGGSQPQLVSAARSGIKSIEARGPAIDHCYCPLDAVKSILHMGSSGDRESCTQVGTLINIETAQIRNIFNHLHSHPLEHTTKKLKTQQTKEREPTTHTNEARLLQNHVQHIQSSRTRSSSSTSNTSISTNQPNISTVSHPSSLASSPSHSRCSSSVSSSSCSSSSSVSSFPSVYLDFLHAAVGHNSSCQFVCCSEHFVQCGLLHCCPRHQQLCGRNKAKGGKPCCVTNPRYIETRNYLESTENNSNMRQMQHKDNTITRTDGGDHNRENRTNTAEKSGKIDNYDFARFFLQ